MSSIGLPPEYVISKFRRTENIRVRSLDYPGRSYIFRKKETRAGSRQIWICRSCRSLGGKTISVIGDILRTDPLEGHDLYCLPEQDAKLDEEFEKKVTWDIWKTEQIPFVENPATETIRIDIGLDKGLDEEDDFSSFPCPLCGHAFTVKHSMHRHLRRKHGEEGMKTANQLQQKDKNFCCPECQKLFKNQDSLRRHISKIHNQENPNMIQKRILCQEMNCGWQGNFRSQLIQHLQSIHGKEFEVLRNEKFESELEFEQFCSALEASDEPTHLCEGIQNSAYKLRKPEDKGRVRRHRECSRSGKFVTQSKGKRFRAQPTSKIGHRCTFHIQYIVEPDGSILVEEAVLNHYGHGTELRHTFLSKSDREDTAHQALLEMDVDREEKKLEIVEHGEWGGAGESGLVGASVEVSTTHRSHSAHPTLTKQEKNTPPSYARTKRKTWNVKCCVDGCGTTDTIPKPDGSGWRLFDFPTDLNRRQLWIQAAKPFAGNFTPAKGHKICERHFFPEAMEGGRDPARIPGICPTEKLPNPARMTLTRSSKNINAPFNVRGRPGRQSSIFPSGLQSRDCWEGLGFGEDDEEMSGNLLNRVGEVSADVQSLKDHLSTYDDSVVSGGNEMELEGKQEVAMEESFPESDIYGFKSDSSHPLAQFAAAFRDDPLPGNLQNSPGDPSGKVTATANGHETNEKNKEVSEDSGLSCCQEIPAIRQKIFSLSQGVNQLYLMLKSLMKVRNMKRHGLHYTPQTSFHCAPRIRGRGGTGRGLASFLERNGHYGGGRGGVVSKRPYEMHLRRPAGNSGSKSVNGVSSSEESGLVLPPSGSRRAEESGSLSVEETSCVSAATLPPKNEDDLPICVARAVLLFLGPIVTVEDFMSHGPKWLSRFNTSETMVVDMFELLLRDGLLYNPIRYWATEDEREEGFPTHCDVYGKMEPERLAEEELDPYEVSLHDYKKYFYQSAKQVPPLIQKLQKKTFDFVAGKVLL